jgi:hypothetical protein
MKYNLSKVKIENQQYYRYRKSNNKTRKRTFIVGYQLLSIGLAFQIY